MTESSVILELRHCRVAEQAPMRATDLPDGTPGVFIAVDDPPPVRTVLTVVEEQQHRPLTVTSVVEVAERDERHVRGFYGRWVEAEALERARGVGTEHMEDGTPVVQPVVPDHSARMDVSDAPVMAVPAPVMVGGDDTGVVDVSGPESGEPPSGEPPSSEVTDEVTARSEQTEHPQGSPTGDDHADPDPDPDPSADAARALQTDHQADPTASEDRGTPEPAGADASSAESESKRSRGGRKKRGRRRR